MIKIFAKVLGNQESGYTKDKPNQRGPYILVPKPAWIGIFPSLSELTLNDAKAIQIITPEGKVAITYLWNNAKFHLEDHPEMSRGHNERRLYRQSTIDNFLELDRKVIVVFANQGDDIFAVSIKPHDPSYNQWNAYCASKFRVETYSDISMLPDVLKTSKPYKELNDLILANLQGAFNETETVGVDEAILQLAKAKKESGRPQQEGADDDPALALSSLIKNQNDFTNFIRKMYDGQCVLRKSKLVNNSSVGLEAAHIMRYADGGPHLPTNGILLSADLHSAFDSGAFTISNHNTIEVHPSIDKASVLWNFADIQITPLPAFSLWLPFRNYKNWHREELFESFNLK